MITTDYVPGAPNWVDLGSPDVEATTAFYRELFGWTHVSAGPEAGGYGFFERDGRTVAAVGPLEEGERSSWTVFFAVADADATAAAVERAGGAVRTPPGDVFTAGRLANLTDPTGAEFAIWQPGGTKGLDSMGSGYDLAWTELYTTDRAAAVDFYRTVLGWESEDAATPAGPYTLVSAPGTGEEGRHGGIMQLPAEDVARGAAAEWHPYFGVDDCDATVAAAAERGATVLIPAMDSEGVGRLAMFADPNGAVAAVITPSRDM